MTAHDPTTLTTPPRAVPDLTPEPEDDLAAAQQKIDNLQVALGTSRVIGMAMGVLMERFKISRDEAFDLLRRLSQETHRKVNVIADDIVFSGEMPLDRPA